MKAQISLGSIIAADAARPIWARFAAAMAEINSAMAIAEIEHALNTRAAKRTAGERLLKARREYTEAARAVEVACNFFAPLIVELSRMRSNIDVSTINNSKRSTAAWTELADRADKVLTDLAAQLPRA